MTEPRPPEPPPGLEPTRRAPGYGVTAGLGAAILEPLAREVDLLGFGTFWSNDRGTPAGDGLADLALVHAVAPSLELGVGVVPLDRVSPAQIAAHVRELGLPLERLWLGVGSGGSPTPIGTVRAGLIELRRLLPDARLVVGALGPQMLQLAGGLADGALLNWIVPARVPWARGQIEAGAAAVGRDPSAIKAWAYIRSAVGPDARMRIGSEAANYASNGPYGLAMTAMGVPLESIGIAGDSLAAQLDPYRSVLDGVVVRALPATAVLEEFVAIARAAAPTR